MTETKSVTSISTKQEDLVKQLGKVTEMALFKKVKGLLETVEKVNNWIAVLIVFTLALTSQILWLRELMYVYVALKVFLDRTSSLSSASDVMTRFPSREYAAFSTFSLKGYIGSLFFIGAITLMDIYQKVGNWNFGEEGWQYVILYIMVECAIELTNVIIAELIALLIFNIAFSDWLVESVKVIARWIERQSKKAGIQWINSLIAYRIHVNEVYRLGQRLLRRFIRDEFDLLVKKIQRITRKEYKQTKKTRSLFWSFCYLALLFAFLTKRVKRLYSMIPLRMPPLTNRIKVLYVNPITFLMKCPIKKPPNKNSMFPLPFCLLCHIHSIIE